MRIIKVAGNTLEINLEACKDQDGQFYYIRRINPFGQEFMNILYTKSDLSKCSDAEIIDKYEFQIEVFTV